MKRRDKRRRRKKRQERNEAVRLDKQNQVSAGFNSSAKDKRQVSKKDGCGDAA